MEQCAEGARPEIAVVHSDRRALMELTVALSRNGFGVTATESPYVLQAAHAALRFRPAAILAALRGDEDIAALARLCDRDARASILFLTPRSGESLARLLRTHGATVLTSDDTNAVVVATLIALLARRAVST